MTKSNSSYLPLKKDGKIASLVRKKVQAGVPVREIFASIQTYQNAPRSYRTFYKYYGDDMEAARGDITERIGNKVVAQAISGDYKSQELWLTTKGGWSKNQTVTTFDASYSEEEKSSAVESLLQKLGIVEEKAETSE